jgi:predicted amidohydrolase
MNPTVRAAAVQLRPVVADVDANLAACERLADEAAREGAQWIALPEFCSTGMGFVPALADAALPAEGAATQLLQDLARRHGAHVGGSFLCRLDDGHVRNRYVLAGPDGVLGFHDKDLPTMWENAFYTGGEDDGVIEQPDGPDAGVALCWELMRSQTARRLRGRVDVVIGGSCWWSVPPWPPRAVTRRWEQSNARNAERAPSDFARLVGAPVIHAAHCGQIACGMPWSPLGYRGSFEGHALIADAHGEVLARRLGSDGPGIVVADVTLGRVPAAEPVPDRFWLYDRGPMPAMAWAYQRAHGRRYYRRHVAAIR